MSKYFVRQKYFTNNLVTTFPHFLYSGQESISTCLFNCIINTYKCYKVVIVSDIFFNYIVSDRQVMYEVITGFLICGNFEKSLSRKFVRLAKMKQLTKFQECIDCLIINETSHGLYQKVKKSLDLIQSIFRGSPPARLMIT